MPGRWRVYLLECADGTYYCGATNDLPARLAAHHAGTGAKYLRGRLPVRLAYARAYRNASLALRAERALKRLTRDQKRALVARS